MILLDDRGYYFFLIDSCLLPKKLTSLSLLSAQRSKWTRINNLFDSALSSWSSLVRIFLHCWLFVVVKS